MVENNEGTLDPQDSVVGYLKERKYQLFEQELEKLINRHSMENGSNTPDFILAKYLTNCLKVFDNAVSKRSDWHK